MGLDHLYTGRTSGSARGKGYNNIFLPSSAVCSIWPIACCVAVLKGTGKGEFGRAREKGKERLQGDHCFLHFSRSDYEREKSDWSELIKCQSST